MGTYLEEFLDSMYMLPSEIKRNFDLMRELEKTTYPLLDEVKSYHKEFLANARRKVLERCADGSRADPDEAELRALISTDDALEKLREKQQLVVQKLDEKIAIAAQSYDLVDHHIRRLDQDLEAYALLLQQNGEFEEDSVPAKKKSKHAGTGLTPSASATDLTKATQGLTPTPSPAITAQAISATPGAVAHTHQSPLGPPSAGGRKATAVGLSRKRTASEVFAQPVLAPTITLGPDDLPVDPNEPLYCHCRRVSYGQMVGCDNDDCKYEWFHFECVGLTDQPQGKWYCPDCRAQLGLQ